MKPLNSQSYLLAPLAGALLTALAAPAQAEAITDWTLRSAQIIGEARIGTPPDGARCGAALEQRRSLHAGGGAGTHRRRRALPQLHRGGPGHGSAHRRVGGGAQRGGGPLSMSQVVSHYETHLAPMYLWMAGGIEHALSLGRSDVAPLLDRPGVAVDSGAGFGMHSIPLARAGFDVLAVDTSPLLLAALRRHGPGLSVTAIEADLLEFAACLRQPVDLILRMGDTLTHLQSTSQVERLLRDVAQALRPGGQFVATFRDYRNLPQGDRRLTPVRSDSKRILTCFLEVMPARVGVHDIVHEWTQDGWSMKVGSYDKLRLAPDTVVRAADGAGIRCRAEPGPRDMVKILAEVCGGRTPSAG